MADALERGQRVQLHVRAMAHGGEGIADAPDGRVVFVPGAIPGDVVDATLGRVKKRWARAESATVVKPSADRIEPGCPAAAAGAGCCDYSHIRPEAQLRLKAEVLTGQLRSLAGSSGVLAGLKGPGDFDAVQLQPATGWRTRVRLGVDSKGRAGMRKARSNDIVAGIVCTQPVPGLLDGLVGPDAQRFTPGAELVAVMDSDGARHVVETAAPRRGQRVEHAERVIEGDGEVVQRVRGHSFRFPPTAFWQAHVNAPEAYSNFIAATELPQEAPRVGWDLYGGVGAFVPAIHAALGRGEVHTVDMSDSAARSNAALADADWHYHRAIVQEGVAQLPRPGLVVLDPPRAGAGQQVVEAVATVNPARVVHVGCDPATFARDAGYFGQQGYVIERMVLIDAFPSTHHFEVLAALAPASSRG